MRYAYGRSTLWVEDVHVILAHTYFATSEFYSSQTYHKSSLLQLFLVYFSLTMTCRTFTNHLLTMWFSLWFSRDWQFTRTFTDWTNYLDGSTYTSIKPCENKRLICITNLQNTYSKRLLVWILMTATNDTYIGRDNMLTLDLLSMSIIKFERVGFYLLLHLFAFLSLNVRYSIHVCYQVYSINFSLEARTRSIWSLSLLCATISSKV
jgi:hypothetical protein